MPRSWNCLNSTITPPIQSFETENDQDLLPKKKTSQNFQNWNLFKNPEAKTIQNNFLKKKQKGVLNVWGLQLMESSALCSKKQKRRRRRVGGGGGRGRVE